VFGHDRRPQDRRVGMNLPDLARALAASHEAPVPQEAAVRQAFRVELARQFEDLLDAVWRAERDWALDDRIELGWRLQQRSART
jgi:hypothetical protein